MSRYEEDKKRYIVVRTVDNDLETIAAIDEYNGNIYWNEFIDNAKKFETLNEAKKFINLQQDLTKLLSKEYEFKILEEHRVIKEV